MKNKLVNVFFCVTLLVCVAGLGVACISGPPARVEVSITNTEPFELVCLKISTAAKPDILWLYPPIGTAKLFGPKHDLLRVVAGGVVHEITTNRAKMFTKSNVVPITEFARLIQWLRQKNVTIDVEPTPTLRANPPGVDTYPGCGDGIDTYTGGV